MFDIDHQHNLCNEMALVDQNQVQTISSMYAVHYFVF